MKTLHFTPATLVQVDATGILYVDGKRVGNTTVNGETWLRSQGYLQDESTPVPAGGWEVKSERTR